MTEPIRFLLQLWPALAFIIAASFLTGWFCASRFIRWRVRRVLRRQEARHISSRAVLRIKSVNDGVMIERARPKTKAELGQSTAKGSDKSGSSAPDALGNFTAEANQSSVNLCHT